ncbi:hypothetical protein ABW09_16620 [Pluralibacter gergoviae]|uniref:2Fe-2S iron-sulfur cluster-binding protein n=1 Tax=Pluralibacter gergoviae TaxID=61647 RepID=UPI000650EB8D|nr:2Fe-2S iron-sulfur cluster-binding protein [Pluralibacter gergoviae]KMK17363.1 hypothetical protein ABW09_16620 [Pluralibacter gergoviae]
MTLILIREHNGTEHQLDAPNGQPLMQALMQSGIDGIEAQCGGNGVCATCHVYIDVPQHEPLDENEDQMLENTASERRPNSRLSCQLLVSDELEGCVVELPERQ